MRARSLLAFPLAALSVGALAACIDLFHSTDFDTMCAAEPSADGCAPDALADGAQLADGPQNQPDSPPPPDGAADGADAGDSAVPPTDFCAWTSTQAHDTAHRACAWLGACAGPLGNNKFGTCLGNAIMAYDCVANPYLKVQGRAHDFWDCMSKVSTCKDVMSCIFRAPTQGCGQSSTEFAACGTSEANARLDCAPAAAPGGPPVGVEECIVSGQTCATAAKTCVGQGSCQAVGAACDGSQIHDCVTVGPDMDDVGTDCAYYGLGECVSPSGGTPSCRPSFDSPTCNATTAITCTGAGNVVAQSCPSGMSTTQVDCRAFMEDAGTCTPSPTGGRPWDVTRACVPSVQQTCTESCLGDGGLLACHHGKPTEVPCGAYGLKPCQTVTNFLVSAPACSPPDAGP